MKFMHEDNGNCRVYYRDLAQIFCWQNDGSFGRDDWKFYRCSSDGEPSHQATPFIQRCPGETAIGQELNRFVAKRQMENQISEGGAHGTVPCPRCNNDLNWTRLGQVVDVICATLECKGFGK